MSSEEGKSEARLVSKAANGNRSAFGALVEPHFGRLIALATRMLGAPHLGEDAVQEGLASVWVARHRLDPAREIGPYLTTVVLNKCRDRLRKRKVRHFLSLGLANDALAIADNSPGPSDIAVNREELKMLRMEIERLPLRLREALVLVSIDGRSQKEAAALLGTTEKAIETRVYRARQRLREKFD